MSRELFVGNLTYDMTSETLKELFSEVGSVEVAKVVMDKATGRSRGFGFVTMQTAEEASAAIQKLNNFQHELNRRDDKLLALRVNYSNSDGARSGPPSHSSRPSGNGGGYGGGGYGGGQRKPYGGGDRDRKY